MNVSCKKCGSKIVETNFSEKQRLHIWGLIVQDLKLFAVKKIKDEFGRSHQDAKVIVSHLNQKIGKCHKCNQEISEEEFIECQNCEAFNYNLNLQSSFNEEFCTHLEWKLDFKNLDNEAVNGYWCDGVDTVPFDIMSLTKKNIELNKEVVTKAWIGNDGQEEFEMKIRFGPMSIKNYLHDMSLINCIPNKNHRNWIKFDLKKKQIEVILL